jgi:hypothetical protein
MGVVRRLREIVSSVASARFPPPPKRRYDLVGEAIERGITGEGGGRGQVRRGGDENIGPGEQTSEDPP